MLLFVVFRNMQRLPSAPLGCTGHWIHAAQFISIIYHFLMCNKQSSIFFGRLKWVFWQCFFAFCQTLLVARRMKLWHKQIESKSYHLHYNQIIAKSFRAARAQAVRKKKCWTMLNKVLNKGKRRRSYACEQRYSQSVHKHQWQQQIPM